jgi:transposase
MRESKDIILVVDYHDENLVVRRLNGLTGEENFFRRPTTAEAIQQAVWDARKELLGGDGKVVWVMESTTGWARVKDLLDSSAEFRMANVLQMPLPPKARRRKTDKIDTGRMLREYLTGTLPLAHQPSRRRREIRRLTAWRESLVSRRTSVRNWIDRYLAHETWENRTGLWSKSGMRWLRTFVASLDGPDRVTLEMKLEFLTFLEGQLTRVEDEMMRVYDAWPEAQRLDAIRGIGPISAVSMLARIGSIQRFANAEQLISYAGLAPGVHQSDSTCRNGRIGGGGTDKRLRHYIIEATLWAREIPRYRPTYERVSAKRGKKIGRLAVGRLLLRSIYKMLREDVNFHAGMTQPAVLAN